METNFASINQEQCAELLLATLPTLMRRIRARFYKGSISGLSMQELKALAIVARSRGASLTTLSEELQHSPPMASKLVSALLKRKLMRSKTDKDDRRKISLELTESGQAMWEQAHQIAMEQVADLIKVLSAQQRAIVGAAMEILKASILENPANNPKK